ncbi:MAG: N-acetylneuraminate synthase family protein [Candidatus Aureabacteria bacterium]|nr:N-acetylneuraminate synthase family protein [Candidatus Auribacterota bacterium]
MNVKDVHVIAEAGTNHNGDFQTAKRLIDVAKESEADSVKFQIIYPEGLYLPGNFKFGNTTMDKVFDMRRRLMLTDDEYQQLSDYASKREIGFAASVFDKRGIDLISSFDPEYIKIASTDLNNLQLLRMAAEKGIRIILSTGMSELDEIERSVNELSKLNFSDIVLLHCVSAYPAKLEDMNLGFLDILKSEFGFPVGLSDHTRDSLASCVALTKGISYLEKHFTLDSTQEGFDHSYALDPCGLKKYIDDVRQSSLALQKAENKLLENEIKVKNMARRSIYAARDIQENEKISEDDVLIVRPPNILSADQIDSLLGKEVNKNIKKHQPLSLDIIKND